MKETYPTSTTWPYALSVMLLLALVLAPPTKWVSTILDVHSDLATWFSPEGPPTHTLAVIDPVVVAFDPRSLEPRLAEAIRPSVEIDNGFEQHSSEKQIGQSQLTDFEIDAKEAAPMLWQEIPLELTELPTEPSLDVEKPLSSVVSTSQPSAVYVWQPPVGWKPALIQPLKQEQMASVSSQSASLAMSQSNAPNVSAASDLPATSVPAAIEPATNELATSEPTASEPINIGLVQPIKVQPPVANRVARLPRIYDEEVQRRLNQSRIRLLPVPIESPSNSTSQEPLQVDPPIEPIDQPAETEIAEQSEPQSGTDRVADQRVDEAPQAQLDPITPSNQPARAARVADVWPTSLVLGELVSAAKSDVVLTNWATTIEQTLAVLQGTRVTGAADQRQALARLRHLATMQVDRTRWPQAHRELHDRLRLALLRRVDVWQPLMTVAYTEPSSFATYRAQKQLQQTAAKLKDTLVAQEHADAWIDYLALDTLQNRHSDKLGYRKLADRVLLRMHSSKLSKQQHEFLQSNAFGQFETDLRTVIAKSVHPSELIDAIETYEATPSRSTANDLILLMQRWHSAPEPKIYKPALSAITTIYRNANLRVSLSEDFINRFVPAMRQYAERVNDTILGAAVTGSSSTYSNLAVKLIPDAQSIRLGLLAAGTVESNTASRKGPVTAFSRGQSAFAAGKEVRLSPQGITTSATETRALSGNELLGIRTDWDDVPFVGSIIRSLAKDEIDEQKQQVQAEMEIRVRRNAQRRMDQELDSRVARAGKNLENNVVQPLRRLQLDPRAMEMRTTEDRAILRTRLAGPWQFGSHSPRPKIRSDSVMSFQIHQSAANNVLEQLQLQNRRMTVEELMATLSSRFGMPLQVIDETHKDIVVKFGEHPMEFDFNDGQVQVTIHFAELKFQNRCWKDFSIRGIYRADVEQLDIALDREGSVSLIGDRIGLRDQLALRGIASKVFGKHQRLQILGDVIQQQPQLSNLTITQFTIRDGWLAVALGEPTGRMRMAERSIGMDRQIR